MSVALVRGGSTGGLLPGGDPFRFDATRLGRFRTAKTIAQGGGSPLDIVFAGDSIFEGSNQTTAAGRWINKMMALIRTRWQPAGVAGGAGYAPADYQSTTMTGPVTFAGTTANATTAAANFGLGAVRFIRMAAAATATFTFTGTGVDIICSKGTAGRTYTYTVDGGAASGTIDTQGTVNLGANSGHVQQIRGLAAGSHTVVITVGAANYVFLEGFMVYNGDESTGIRAWESGAAGARAADFKEIQASYWYGEYALPQPDLVVVGFGANDYGTPTRVRVTPRQYAADVLDLIQTIRAQCVIEPSIVVWEPAQPAGSSYNTGAFLGQFSDYAQALRQMAKTDGRITLFDAAAVMGDQSSGANTLVDADKVHPSAAGHTALAAAMDALLAAA